MLYLKSLARKQALKHIKHVYSSDLLNAIEGIYPKDVIRDTHKVTSYTGLNI